MNIETVVFGGGCFWCTEAVFTMLKGVKSALPGYSGPAYRTDKGPGYEEVSTGSTPYIESAKIEFDPDTLSFEELLQVFFATHDPTTPNRQSNDVGPQYHSAVWYTTEQQKAKVEHYIMVLQKMTTKSIVTTVAPLDHFYVAEDYHQQYYEHHKDAPYCQLVIDPKVEKVQEKFGNLLK